MRKSLWAAAVLYFSSCQIGCLMADPPTIEVPLETVCFIIVKAREFDVKDSVADPEFWLEFHR